MSGGYPTGSLAGALELTPGYRISIPLTHVDGPEERELLRRRHPPHPDIPRNLIAQGWFENGYDTAALEFWDVVHEANRELAARDAEIERLTAASEQFKKEVSWARDKLAARVSSLEAELAEAHAELERTRRVLDAVLAVLEKGPRYTDRHMEAAADSVVEEIREAIARASGEARGVLP